MCCNLFNVDTGGGSNGGGSATPSLPLNSVQFNNGGSFGGSGNFIFDSGTDELTLVGAMTATSFNGVSLTDAGSVNNVLTEDGTYQPSSFTPPLNTVFVTTEADLPATQSIDTGAFGTFDFHVVTTDTEFVWIDSPPLVDGISVNPGIKCIITSANKDSARILPDFSGDNNRLFLYAVAADSLTVKDVEISNVAWSRGVLTTSIV